MWQLCVVPVAGTRDEEGHFSSTPQIEMLALYKHCAILSQLKITSKHNLSKFLGI